MAQNRIEAPNGDRSATIATHDPVCGMTVDPATPPHHADHAGQSFHFCSAGCRAKFIADPLRYLPMRRALPRRQARTCPMHSQIRQAGAGSCPICGMALEPAAPSMENRPNPELVDFTRRFWVSAVLAVPLLVLTMGTDILGLHFVSSQIPPWLQLALASPIVLWAGAPFFVRGWASF